MSYVSGQTNGQTNLNVLPSQSSPGARGVANKHQIVIKIQNRFEEKQKQCCNRNVFGDEPFSELTLPVNKKSNQHIDTSTLSLENDSSLNKCRHLCITQAA